MAEWIQSNERKHGKEVIRTIVQCIFIMIVVRFIMTIFRFIIMIVQFIFLCIRKYFCQLNISLDTSLWPEGFDSPPECKSIIFALTESQLSTDTCPIMEFVQKYSSKFLHVQIEYTFSRRVEKRLIKSWCRHFILFLQMLTSNSQLISVKFLDLSYCFERIDTPTYVDICRTIIHFLESQHRLKRVEFRICCFRFNEGVEILRKLTGNKKESLSHLALVQFIRYEPMDKVISSFDCTFVINPSTALQNLPLLSDFPSLTSLEIDYSLLFENMVSRFLRTCQSTAIQTAKNCQTLVLSKIFLHYDNTIIPIEVFRGLTSTDWRFLKILCPDLQAGLIFYTNSPSRREVEFLIVPNMPITRLIYICDISDMGMDIGVLFGHLLACKTNDHLVSLEINIARPLFELASTFPPFLQACRKLKCLNLDVSYPTNGIDLLMQSWRKNRPESLEKVCITILEKEEEYEYANLINLASELKWKGLNVEVHLFF